MWPLCGHLSHQKEDWESGQLRFNVSTRKWPRRLRKGRSVMSDSLQPHRLYSPWNSPGQNTGMGSQPFPSPGDSQPRDWTQVSRIAGRFFTSWATREAPKWVAYPFSSGSSWNRNLFIFKSYNIFSVLKLKKKKKFLGKYFLVFNQNNCGTEIHRKRKSQIQPKTNTGLPYLDPSVKSNLKN